MSCDIYSGLQYQRHGLTRLVEQVQGELVQVWPTMADSPDSAPSSLNRFSSEDLSSFSIQRHSHSPKRSLQTPKRIVHVFSCRINHKRRYTGPPSRGTKRKIGGLQRTGCGPEEATQASVRSRPGSRGAADALCGDGVPAITEHPVSGSRTPDGLVQAPLRHILKNRWHKPTCTIPTNTMEALLVRRLVSATGLQGRALLRIGRFRSPGQ